MASEEVSLSGDARIKSLLFQYLKLYERWSEDRQAFNKNMATHADRLAFFGDKLMELKACLETFEKLEPRVRHSLAETLKETGDALVEAINERVGGAVTSAVHETAEELHQALKGFYPVLMDYQAQMQGGRIEAILMTVGAGIISSLLIVWLLVPKPFLPLTGDMLSAYVEGLRMKKVYSTLSSKTQKEIDKAFKENFDESQPFHKRG